MKITGENPFVKLEAYVRQVRDKKSADSPSPKLPEETHEGDKVILSPRAKELLEAKKALDSLPHIREEKVEQIKLRIEKGTYQVEGEKIALKLIEEALLDEIS